MMISKSICMAIVGFATMGSLPAAAQDSGLSSNAGLSQDWIGKWSGTMTITMPDGKLDEVTAKFEVQATDTDSAWTWAATYGEAGKKVVKNYRLIALEDSPNRYQIDEGNGIVLNAIKVDQVILSHFSVGKSVLTARYELKSPSEMTIEVTSSLPSGEPDSKFDIQDFEIRTVQTSRLTKVTEFDNTLQKDKR